MSKTHLHDNEVILDVKNLRVAYGKVEALHEVSLTIRRGEIVTVIGPNGAGKSTLTNLLSGDLPPTSGTIALGTHDITTASPEQISRRGLGRSYQKTNIFLPFTVWENVRLAAQSRAAQQPFNPLRWLQSARGDAAVNERAEKALELAGLTARRDFIAGKFHLKIEKSEFNIAEYGKFLQVNEESIAAFEAKRKKAFEEEKERWIATGQLTFESHALEAAPQESVTLEDGEDGVYSPVAGSLWKLSVGPGQKIKAGDTLAVLESMKTEIPVCAETDGTVGRTFVKTGEEVRSGKCLLSLKV